jgi:hypothetical protein
MNQGRSPPRWHAVTLIGTRCWMDFHSLAAFRLAIGASQPGRSADSDAFAECGDDFNLLGFWKDIHGRPNPSC